MEFAELYKKAEEHVRKMFAENKNENLVFHNLHHTVYVVEKANEITAHYRLSERETFIISMAAWFHDTGYLFVKAEEHETKSVELMKSFFQQQDYDITIIEAIADCILVTKFPSEPKGLLQEIMRDADSYNFGTKDFKVTNKLVFRELNNTKIGGISKDIFNKHAYKMLEDHKYYTDYCKDELNKGKKANMKAAGEKTW